MENPQQKKLIGPFKQILTMNGLPLKGSLSDSMLEIIHDGGVIVSRGKVCAVGQYNILNKETWDIKEELEDDLVLLPGFIDSHTHLCWGGSRAADYAMRIAGVPYLEIAKAGGGIISSVMKTREASTDELLEGMMHRLDRHFSEGVTTCEVKSGYGLSYEDELKMLQVINLANWKHEMDIVPTCLAAHICPPEFDNPKTYLDDILTELLPAIEAKGFSDRVDIFIEDTAFSCDDAKYYLTKAKGMGFQLTIHADQFSTDGSRLACEIGAISADHLEKSGEKEIKMLAESDVVANVLPGASLGLGMPYAPARKLLDAGCCVAIASDWNPGSAPMGDLLMQAAVLSAAEKMTIAETLAAITFRAAKALDIKDKGLFNEGYIADMIAFPTNDYRDILYHQGKMKPVKIWKRGNLVSMGN